MKSKRVFMLSIVALLAATMSLGLSPALKTAEAGAKADWKFHDIVSVNFVQQHVKVPKADNVMIIDSRPYQPKYVKGHIPTAVSIPHTKFDQLKGKLPKDKNALLIFYCGGLK
ncbi:MAG: rhodanese-like domain-containing protein [Syntrophobacterales bacterium]